MIPILNEVSLRDYLSRFQDIDYARILRFG
jgi:hypothetical protein